MPDTRGPNRRTSPLTGLFLGSLLGSMSSRRNRANTYDYDPQYPPQMPPQYGAPRRKSSGMSWIWIVLLVVIVMFALGMCGCSHSDSESSAVAENRYNREKIQNSVAFSPDCIVDELGFFENPSKTGQQLKSFYDKTGIQPYIVIEDYNPSLRDDAQKEEFAKEYYDKYINNEDTFLYLYFADQDPDSIGYMSTVNGKNIEAVMDKQAVDTFWNYLDQEWTSGKETDEMFVDVFNKTADRIMTKSTTSNDVAMRGLLIGGIVVVAGAVILLVVLKQKREREKAEETRRILETPLKTDDPDDDDLVNRYGG